jgi:hypothetical protein
MEEVSELIMETIKEVMERMLRKGRGMSAA